MRKAILRPAARTVQWLAVASLAILPAACAHRSLAPDSELLVIVNDTPDPIRVTIQIGSRELVLGRVEPMSREALRVWRGEIPPGAIHAYVRVVPAEWGQRSDPVGVRTSRDISLLVRTADLGGASWRYTGTQLIAAGR